MLFSFLRQLRLVVVTLKESIISRFGEVSEQQLNLAKSHFKVSPNMPPSEQAIRNILDNCSSEPKTSDPRCCKLLWSLKLPPKWKLFMWKLIKGGLATKVGLNRRRLQISVMCDFFKDWLRIFNTFFSFMRLQRKLGGVETSLSAQK